MLTANLAAEVSPTMRSCFPKSPRRTPNGALAMGAQLEGQARDAQVEKAGVSRVPDSWRTSRQERAGTIKAKDGRRRTPGREMGESSGKEMGDKGEVLGGIV